MVTGNIPWNTSSFSTIRDDIISCNYLIPLEIPCYIRELISIMLTKDPNLRPSLSQIIQLPFFKSFIPQKRKKNVSLFHHREITPLLPKHIKLYNDNTNIDLKQTDDI